MLLEGRISRQHILLCVCVCVCVCVCACVRACVRMLEVAWCISLYEQKTIRSLLRILVKNNNGDFVYLNPNNRALMSS